MSTLAVPQEAQEHPPPKAQRKSTKKTGYTRQRRGCLTCRLRKKKCDQALPVCGHCSRLNLVCKHEQPRQLSTSWGDDVVESSASASPAHAQEQWSSSSPGFSQGDHASEVLRLANISEPLDLVRPDDAVGRDLSASRRTMMRYYTTTLAIMLSATAENNCFLSVLLPMAFDCPTLLDAMAAWSSAHLALRDSSFRDTSLQHRGKVLASLGAALKDGSLSEEMCLAVAMAMCSMETISDATSSSWAHHLSGAAAALQSKSSSDMQLIPLRSSSSSGLSEQWLKSVEGKWLVRNFAYHDILMSVSLDRRPLITGDYWMSADDGLADPYFAFASRIMLSTSEISVLNADCAEHKASLAPFSEGLPPMDPAYDAFLHRAHSIAADLRDWKCPAASADTPLALLSETYRSAGLIYLDRVVRKYLPAHAAAVLPEGIWTYVESVCDVAQKVPEGSLAECSLLFPLFIAGGEAEDAGHVARIRNRLCTMNRWRRFRNVDACREVLEDVWALRGEGRQGVDWRHVVEQRGWQLALS